MCDLMTVPDQAKDNGEADRKVETPDEEEDFLKKIL